MEFHPHRSGAVVERVKRGGSVWTTVRDKLCLTNNAARAGRFHSCCRIVNFGTSRQPSVCINLARIHTFRHDLLDCVYSPNLTGSRDSLIFLKMFFQ